MNLAAFDFNLPDEAIALRPANPRDSARLLEIRPPESPSDYHVYNLPDLLRAGDILVLNETRVFPAALKAIRKARPIGGGGDVSIMVNLHQPIGSKGWRAFVKPAKRLKSGDRLYFSGGFTAEVSDKQPGGDVMLSFDLEAAQLMEMLESKGDMPLPPYIARQRPVDEKDATDYQTVYAKNTGSVAAPTAGLHFTDRLLNDIAERNIELAKLTLHVGAGTFLPVKSDNIEDHKMHSEAYSLSQRTCEKIMSAKARGGRVIAVGTTSLRALESAAKTGQLEPKTESTDIFITPGYEFKVVDGLMTNFHLPKSTLFMLVCALAGNKVMQDAYAYALEQGYRFYSYGDSSLIWGSN